ncbi:hypothetical protein X975_21140, partial [Stegodyphus mimosarum]
MALKFSLWAFLTSSLCLVVPSLGEIHPHSMTPSEPANKFLDEKTMRYIIPEVMALSKKLDLKAEGYKSNADNRKLGTFLRLLTENETSDRHLKSQTLKKRKFPEIDSRGFDEDIFDEGFGDWSPMKRW